MRNLADESTPIDGTADKIPTLFYKRYDCLLEWRKDIVVDKDHRSQLNQPLTIWSTVSTTQSNQTKESIISKTPFRLIQVSTWACLVALLGSITCVRATSLAQHVFLPRDRSENPFSDPFIQRIVNMDRAKLSAIPRMSDDAFLAQLASGDDTLGGPFHS